MMSRIASLAALLLGLLCLPGVGQDPAAGDPTKPTPPPLLLRNPTLAESHVAFAYADDLWIVPRSGGEARRLTSGSGVETDPIFSPNGELVAFTGQYDGNEDVYVVPAAGGEARRLTYHPGPDQAVGWTPDGKRVLFRSTRSSHARLTHLFTVGLDGGVGDRLPLPMADHGVYSPDGKRFVYTPHVNFPRRIGFNVPWRNYKGGKQPYLWIADLADSRVEKLPRTDSNDTHPMWIGDSIYFLSDREGATTLFQYDLASKKVRKRLDSADDIRSASAGPDAIVYEKANGLFLFDLESGKSTRLEVSIRADLPGVRTRFVKLGESITRAGLSPSGARAVFESRGEILTVPASKGQARNLTQSSGVAERDPAWSPDGKAIGYFSDESGEYQLHIAAADGKGAVKKFQLGDRPSFYYHPSWSPDGKKIAYSNKALELWYIDLATGKSIRVDTNPYFDIGRIGIAAWSPDGKWLAYSRQLKNYLFAVFLYSLESGKTTQVTDGMSDASGVQFDRGGKYLYFTASTDVGPARGSLMSALNRPTSRNAYIVVLSADEPSPLAPESDEEKEADRSKDEENSKKPADRVKKPVTVRIDLADIDQRVLTLPVPARNYTSLAVGKAGQIYLVEGPEVSRAAREPGETGFTLHRFDLGKRKTEKVAENVSHVSIADNGEKMLFRQAGKFHIVSTQQPIKPGEGALRLEDVETRIDPRQEWAQIYREAFRIQRDFLYDPGYHGLDLKATQSRYAAYLPGVASRYDLNHLLDEALRGLSLGHVYISGGDSRSVRGPGGGLLGADFEIANGCYRIQRIYRGENWNPTLRAPLTQPGARVREGEYVLAIDGKKLQGSDSIHRLLEGKANRTVTLTVGPRPDGTEAREVSVQTIADEQPLRHYAWVSDNRARVEKMTGGKVAYIYLPNTAAAGHDRFVREFYAQVGKEAVIIDERFNGGGFLADQVIDALGQKPRNYIATRQGEDMVFPRGIFGPKVMLINESAGSGGDYLPYTFRQARLGTLVGKRTWGGLVGIGGYPSLIDGGSITAPHWAIYFPNGKWDVENQGVAPDIEVEFDPRAAREGRDPQLEKAVEIALAELKKQPLPQVRRPAYPNYHRK